MRPWSAEFNDRVRACRRCPRLVAWRERVAREKKREFRDEDYWGRPVPSFGDPRARLVIVGLAPAAHGANRTGRMFTGDQSGRWLYRALHKAGFAATAGWERRDDGQRLIDCYITAALHCAPPANKPTPAELANCGAFFAEELRRLRRARVVVALGRIAFAAYLKARGVTPVPAFAHNAVYRFEPVVIASYHPSRQNTNTGKLTEPMLDAVFAQARQLLAPIVHTPHGSPTGGAGEGGGAGVGAAFLPRSGRAGRDRNVAPTTPRATTAGRDRNVAPTTQ